jgi:3-deoxy-D-manno-octulosonic-acid transferase
LAVPIVFGPHVFNFVEISERLLSYGAAIQISNAEDLARVVTDLLQHSEKRSSMGAAGKKFVEQNNGAVNAVSTKIQTLLK